MPRELNSIYLCDPPIWEDHPSPILHGEGGQALGSPLDLDGVGGLNVRLWWRADSLSLANNDPVTTWADESGNGSDLSQSTGANKPTYQTNVQNGLPAVRYNGTAHFMKTAAVTTWPSKRGSLFIAARKSGGGYGSVIATYDATNPDWQFIWPGTGNGFWGYYDNTVTRDLETVTDDTVARILSLIRTADTSMTFWRDGTEKNTVTHDDNQPASNTVAVGANNLGSPTEWFTGDIFEIILYDGDVGGQRTSIENYLNNKWAIF